MRASLACHTTEADIDRLVAALRSITTDGPRADYRPVPEHETYEPVP